MIKTVIWDWNGTLFNDVECSYNILNTFLVRRNLRPLKNVEAYKEIFCFPVIKVYEQVGINFLNESFEKISVEYTNEYEKNYRNYNLHIATFETLHAIKEMGINNILLSASQVDILKFQANYYKCDQYFDEILGLDNVYANSKIQLALEWMKRSELKPEEVLWIGDTTHDYECAVQCQTNCILISNGHQTKERLQKVNPYVVEELTEIIENIRRLNS